MFNFSGVVFVEICYYIKLFNNCHYYRFLGVLMGIAIRTGSPLSLNLAEPVWKQLAGMDLTPADLTEIDRYLLLSPFQNV